MIIQFKFGIFRGAELPFFGDIECKEDLLLHKRNPCFARVFSMAKDIKISPGITGSGGTQMTAGLAEMGVSQKGYSRVWWWMLDGAPY